MKSPILRLFVLLLLIVGCSKDSDTTNTEQPISQTKEYTLTVSNSPSEGGTVSPLNGTYDEGTVVSIEGTPLDGYLFKEWSGDVQGTDNPVSFTMDSNKNVTGVFEVDCELLKYPLIDSKQPSYFTDILNHPDNINDILRVYDDQEGGYGYGSEKINLDYNLDGYLDFVSFRNDYDSQDNRQPIRFFKGTCSGEMIYDELNSEKFIGLVHGRKILVGDYNNDEFPDIFFIGHGYDKPPFPGEYPVVLFSDGEGGFDETRLTQFVSFYHGGSSGDYDFDGDLDVVLVTGSSNTYLFLENDGFGNFNDNTSILPIQDELVQSKYSSEFYDIDNDGDLELFLFGFEGNSVDSYIPTVSIDGNGIDFSGEIKTLPKVSMWGMVLDFSFYDIDSNGTIEILINRTKPNYEGWYIQVVESVNGVFVDSTEKFISDNFNESENWNIWIYTGDFERNGTIELRNSSNPDVNHQNLLSWELIGGKFVRKN
ncbi:VCBS repeat-containing protein [Maribacter sp. ACAM166]|jgi:hypothetical protein|uniref:VCBS repeat-containing protein n=1 Tax=Maribacter sp. ACAM166 TaxID=2508996 RepID=UPI0010FF2205|nr:VCBS repeat-containing protein [Maribacter sp. ACAM166]TLP72898.1 VCBS repeat-containing protein [Maribacter sp. ACAM166]